MAQTTQRHTGVRKTSKPSFDAAYKQLLSHTYPALL